MINKQSIYYWFFFPLLALLSAGSLTSCIYDSVLEEEDTSGKSTLSITMRGITTTDPSTSGGSYDDYVKTLRVIGFDANGSVVCNQLFDYDANTTEIPDFIVQGTGEDAQINITQTMKDAFQGGVCDFYFIANEGGYSVYNTTSAQNLSAFLGDISSKSELEDCMLATPEDLETLETLGSSPILMTTSVRSTLKPGDNTINNIELVRCFAKVQLKIIDKTGSATVGEDPVLAGTYPDSYSLWDGSTTGNWTSSDDNKVDIPLELKEETIEVDGQTYPLHTSQEIYFPERLFGEENNQESNAMKFSFTLNGKSYAPAIANSERTDFNIRRNTHYTVTATLKSTPVNVTFNIEVIPWSEVEVDVPPFE